MINIYSFTLVVWVDLAIFQPQMLTWLFNVTQNAQHWQKPGIVIHLGHLPPGGGYQMKTRGVYLAIYTEGGIYLMYY